jgi:hypothetical protein
MPLIFGVDVPDGEPLSQETIERLIEERQESRKRREYKISDDIRTYLRKRGICVNDTARKWTGPGGTKGNIIQTSRRYCSVQQQKVVPSISEKTVKILVIITLNVKNVLYVGDSIKSFPVELTQIDKNVYVTERSIECQDTPVKRQEEIGILRRKCIMWLKELGEIQISPESQLAFTHSTKCQFSSKVQHLDFSTVSGEWSNQVADLSFTPYV